MRMKIYVSGVGVGMGPLAFIARDAGHHVVCSDLVEHELVEYMRAEGFNVHIGQSGQSIKEEHESEPIDWFIHTSALPQDHPELRYAHDVGMKTSKRDAFINELLVDHELEMIAVAGTHGKTNTTAMVAWSLMQAGIPISYSIGARLPFGPFGKYQKGSRYFIYEADEFDKNFLQYHPKISLITNIGYDHPDTYPSQLDYDMAFAQFIDQSENVYIYADYFDGASDKIHTLTKDEDEASTTIPGKYIRQNARLVLEMLHKEFDVPMVDAVDYINNFPGSSRRMEEVAPNIYSDYAHHPDEIRATLELGMEISDDVVVVYQPHQNVRQHEVMDSYTDCFEGASKLYWLPTYLSREDASLDVLTPEQLIGSLTNKELAEIAKMDDSLAVKLNEHLDSGALIIAMAAGNLDSWVRENFSSSDETEL